MTKPKSAVRARLSRLEPVDKARLYQLSASGKANPDTIKTVRCRTVAVGRFRHENYIRGLPAHIVDEPPALLGDDTAPNPSEAALAALGTCLAVGIHANAVARNIAIVSLEVELEGDINISAVWGTGDLAESKPVGFTEVRVNVKLDADAPFDALENLVAHAVKWSPVANTFQRPVPLKVGLAG